MKHILSILASAVILTAAAQTPVDSILLHGQALPVYSIIQEGNAVEFILEPSTYGTKLKVQNYNSGDWTFYLNGNQDTTFENVSNSNLSGPNLGKICDEIDPMPDTWDVGPFTFSLNQAYAYGIFGGVTSYCVQAMMVDYLTLPLFGASSVTDTVYVDVLVTDTVYIEVPADSAFCIQYLQEAYDEGYDLGYTHGLGMCPEDSCPADLNDDGIISTADLLEFLGVFSLSCDEFD